MVRRVGNIKERHLCQMGEILLQQKSNFKFVDIITPDINELLAFN